MSEIWIPEPNKPTDVGNIYDLMTVFEEQMAKYDSLRDAYHDALFAVRSLGIAIANLPRAKKEISLVARGAIVDSVEHRDTRILIDRDIGIEGTLLDVRAEPLKLNGDARYHLSLEVDILSMYPMEDPSDCDQLLRPGSVPISMVDCISSAA